MPRFRRRRSRFRRRRSFSRRRRVAPYRIGIRM